MRPKKILHPLIFLFVIVTIFSLSRTTPASAQNDAYRNITITALVDRDLMEKDAEETKRKIKEIIEFVGSIFKKEFSVTFTLRTIKPWEFPYGKKEVDGENAIYDIEQALNYEDSDLVLGFTKGLTRCTEQNTPETIKGMPCPQDKKRNIGGFTFIHGKIAIMLLDKFITLHEVGHMFGSDHSEDASSVMHEWANKSLQFDTKSKDIIQKNIEEKFLIKNTP